MAVAGGTAILPVRKPGDHLGDLVGQAQLSVYDRCVPVGSQVFEGHPDLEGIEPPGSGQALLQVVGGR